MLVDSYPKLKKVSESLRPKKLFDSESNIYRTIVKNPFIGSIPGSKEST